MYICQMEQLNRQLACGFEIMEQVHGMDILCNERRGDNLRFCIQASNPKIQCIADCNDKTLADAIESMFSLNTENAILTWNYISIPLSYKYDISYMMEDILVLLNALQSRKNGELTIHWLPDTFRCDWTARWTIKELSIWSQWERTVGNLEILLNGSPSISLNKDDFIKEWKSILGIIINGFRKTGYDAEKIRGMKRLIEQYESIDGNGILYRD